MHMALSNEYFHENPFYAEDIFPAVFDCATILEIFLSEKGEGIVIKYHHQKRFFACVNP